MQSIPSPQPSSRLVWKTPSSDFHTHSLCICNHTPSSALQSYRKAFLVLWMWGMRMLRKVEYILLSQRNRFSGYNSGRSGCEQPSMVDDCCSKWEWCCRGAQIWIEWEGRSQKSFRGRYIEPFPLQLRGSRHQLSREFLLICRGKAGLLKLKSTFFWEGKTLGKKEILRCLSVKETWIGETGRWTYPQTDKENSSLCTCFTKHNKRMKPNSATRWNTESTNLHYNKSISQTCLYLLLAGVCKFFAQ